MQKTLFSYWKSKPFYKEDVCKKRAKYPRVITKLIHSFLPSTQELWIEQRLRYMATSAVKSKFTEWNWPKSYSQSLFGHPLEGDFDIPHEYQVFIDYDLDSTVLELKRTIRHITVSYANENDIENDFWYCWQQQRLVSQDLHVIFEILRSLNQKTVEEAMRKNEVPPIIKSKNMNIPKITKRNDLLLFPPFYEQIPSTRLDGTHQFFRTPSVQTLHLLL
jgi:hypothetical protein